MTADQLSPGPCLTCGSTNTIFTTVKPPKVKKRGEKESKTFHRCTECEQVVRFCISCHMVAPLPVGMTIPEIPTQ